MVLNLSEKLSEEQRNGLLDDLEQVQDVLKLKREILVDTKTTIEKKFNECISKMPNDTQKLMKNTSRKFVLQRWKLVREKKRQETSPLNKLIDRIDEVSNSKNKRPQRESYQNKGVSRSHDVQITSERFCS